MNITSDTKQDIELYTQVINKQLSDLIVNHLAKNPYLSLGAVSQRCRVSEPTLRRIKNGRVKTLPNTSTVMGLLQYLLDSKDLSVILEKTHGALKEYLAEMVPQTSENVEFDPKLNEELGEPVKYLVYKLAANHSGVSDDTIERMFGYYGLQKAQELSNLGIIEQRGQCYFSVSGRAFAADPDKFNENFVTVAAYISNTNDPSFGLLNSFHCNYSESVSAETYRTVAQLMKKTLKRVRQICNKETAKGHIPLLVLNAVDTLDVLAPHQINKKNH